MSCDPFDPSADPALAALVPGLVLAGRFELIGFAGKGGMAVVWRARDRSLDQDVAMKFIPSLVASDSISAKDLRREAKRARELTHPYICRVHDYGEDLERGLAWISMEYLPGETLTRKLRANPRRFFEVEEIKRWADQLCDALAYAHERAGLVHRDLKPSNLLLDARGDVKVSDFGIAQTICESVTRLTGGVSPSGTSGSGTPLYMSPQQARGDRPRATDDLYSLGATLFELLTGKAPFFMGDLNFQRQHVPAPRVGDRRRELHQREEPIPEQWEITIQRLLAKFPEHRPQSAREVAEALKKEQPAGTAPPVPPTPPASATHIPITAEPSPSASATTLMMPKKVTAQDETHVPPGIPRPPPSAVPPQSGLSAPVSNQLPPPGALPEPGQSLGLGSLAATARGRSSSVWRNMWLWTVVAVLLLIAAGVWFAFVFFRR